LVRLRVLVPELRRRVREIPGRPRHPRASASSPVSGAGGRLESKPRSFIISG
jgi:hypothetical protein